MTSTMRLNAGTPLRSSTQTLFVAGRQTRRLHELGAEMPEIGFSDMKDNESPMAYRSNNLVTGRQLRAARILPA